MTVPNGAMSPVLLVYTYVSNHDSYYHVNGMYRGNYHSCDCKKCCVILGRLARKIDNIVVVKPKDYMVT